MTYLSWDQFEVFFPKQASDLIKEYHGFEHDYHNLVFWMSSDKKIKANDPSDPFADPWVWDEKRKCWLS